MGSMWLVVLFVMIRCEYGIVILWLFCSVLMWFVLYDYVSVFGW